MHFMSWEIVSYDIKMLYGYQDLLVSLRARQNGHPAIFYLE